MFGFPATGQQVGFSEGAPDVGHRYSGRGERGCSSALLRVSKLIQAGLAMFWTAARVDSRSPLARMMADSQLAYAALYRMGWYSLTLPWVASSLSSIVGRRPVPRRRRIKRVGFEFSRACDQLATSQRPGFSPAALSAPAAVIHRFTCRRRPPSFSTCGDRAKSQAR